MIQKNINYSIEILENMIYIYTILKLLPQNIDITSEDVNLMKAILWENYKSYMLKKFSIVLKKEEQINPNILINDIDEIKNILSSTYNYDTSKLTEKINKFAKNLKDYYTDLSNASKLFLIRYFWIP